MKKQSFLFITLILSIFSSCKRDIVESADTPMTQSNDNTNPTSYVLKRQTWTGTGSNGQSFLYEYNSDHLVSKIERYQWGTYREDGGSEQRWETKDYYTFEYTNGLCNKWRIQETGIDYYFIYEYNNKNLPVKRTAYSTYGNTPQGYSFYKYDNLNNLVEKVDSSDKLDFRFVFTYNSTSNLTSVIKYILWSTPQKKEKYEWLSFDNKVNFIRAVNGLPITFIWDNNYNAYSSSSPNNFIARNHYAPVDISQPFGHPDYFDNSFDYNEQGLPLKLEYGTGTVTFEYEKYK